MVNFGSVADLTAVYGAVATYDTFINANGEVIDEGNQSIDICVSDNDSPDCLAQPS